ncbi:MAG: response regulator [Gammaproteobacteria bacterium]|nr:MAG: response regulator [Gammaproteobacteria bacterium]
MKRALIVDDNADNRYYLRALLEGLGWEVEEAPQGADALFRARARVPDIVISDLLMPVMDGYTLLQHWKADGQLCRVPFVVYTATYTGDADAKLALDLGADAFIVKPAEPAPFLQRIEEILAQTALPATAVPRMPDAEAGILLQQYNEVLVRKLEQKVLELERTHRELSVREAHLRAIIDTEPECVILLEADGTVLNLNPAGVALLGGDGAGPITGGSVYALIAGRDRDPFREFSARTLTGESGTLEFHVATGMGAERLLELHATALRDPASDRPRLLGVARDITAEREAEQKLLEASDRLRRALDAGRVGLWEWDLKTDQMSFSAEWRRQLGFVADDPSPSTAVWQDRVHPDDLERVREEFAAHRAGRIPEVNIEFRIRHRDDSWRHHLVRGSIVRDASGVPVQMRGSGVDITDRIELEGRYLQAQKMESIGRLAGGVAHDFNNLLTVILGTIDLTLEQMDAAAPSAGLLREGRRAAERATALTRQLLAFSRRQVTRPEVLDLGVVVRELSGMLQRLIGEHVRQTVVAADGLWPVRADRGQLEQVIMNLAVNARDAMPEGGGLTIETGNVEFDELAASQHPPLPAGSFVQLTVTDTGIGMDAETRERIFEPFFTTKEVGHGTGLGLSTVYGIIEQLRGGIWVYSEPGRGTTFKIYLPRSLAAGQTEAATAPAVVITGTEAILVVEDDDALREIATSVLRSAGYTVLAAANARAALDIVTTHHGPLQLMLTDMIMPGMGGRDLATRLAEIRPDIRVLFTSGYTDDAILRQSVLEASDHFLSKPYTMAELTRRIRKVLDE